MDFLFKFILQLTNRIKDPLDKTIIYHLNLGDTENQNFPSYCVLYVFTKQQVPETVFFTILIAFILYVFFAKSFFLHVFIFFTSFNLHSLMFSISSGKSMPKATCDIINLVYIVI